MGGLRRFGNDKPLRTLGNGAQGRNRTTDTVIFSHVLYQLSYLGSRRQPVRAREAGAL
jgi:hypothetical protein